jgi:hypothetical protein
MREGYTPAWNGAAVGSQHCRGASAQPPFRPQYRHTSSRVVPCMNASDLGASSLVDLHGQRSAPLEACQDRTGEARPRAINWLHMTRAVVASRQDAARNAALCAPRRIAPSVPKAPPAFRCPVLFGVSSWRVPAARRCASRFSRGPDSAAPFVTRLTRCTCNNTHIDKNEARPAELFSLPLALCRAPTVRSPTPSPPTQRASTQCETTRDHGP